MKSLLRRNLEDYLYSLGNPEEERAILERFVEYAESQGKVSNGQESLFSVDGSHCGLKRDKIDEILGFICKLRGSHKFEPYFKSYRGQFLMGVPLPEFEEKREIYKLCGTCFIHAKSNLEEAKILKDKLKSGYV